MRLAVPAVVIVAAAALVGLLVYGLVAKGENTTIEDGMRTGEPVAAFSRELPVLGSDRRSSPAAYRGEVVVLNFWASWCEPCRAETPLLERWQKRMRRSGATVLGVNYRDTTPDALRFARKYGVTFPSLRDVDGELARDYGTRALPETFVIDRAGRVVAVSRGTVTERFLARNLEPLL